MSLNNQFTLAKFEEAFKVIKDQFPGALWETFYATMLATIFAIIIGLPIGVLFVVGEKNGVMPIPSWILKVLNVTVNILRSIPFLILIVVVLPLTRAIIGTTVGTAPSIVPLVIAAFPFIARLVEGSLREINPNIIEAAQSMGASPLQIIVKVMLPESVPSLISNFTIAITTILGYTAMSGAVGGGGLGMIAISYGYNRYRYLIMIFSVVLLVLMVQFFQTVGTYAAIKSDKRLKGTVVSAKKSFIALAVALVLFVSTVVVGTLIVNEITESRKEAESAPTHNVTETLHSTATQEPDTATNIPATSTNATVAPTITPDTSDINN